MGEDDRMRPTDPQGSGEDQEDAPETSEPYPGYEGYSASGELNIGELLERARKRKGLSLQDVEDATKIRKRYIDGLEREDYTVLPDSVYARGFLKTYANFLGLDGNKLSGDLKNRRGRRREKRQPTYGNVRRTTPTSIRPEGLSGARRAVPPATLLTVILAVVVIALVIGVLYFIGRGGQAADTTSSDGAAAVGESLAPGNDAAGGSGTDAPADENAPGSEGRSTDTDASAEQSIEEDRGAGVAPESDTLRVEIRVRNARSWVSVTSDDTVEYARVARPGFTDVFEAERAVSINAGNAGNVLVSVNGQDVGTLGANGESLVREFTLKDAS